MVGEVVKSKIKVEYAFQDMTDIHEGCFVPPERKKSLGKVQAVLAIRSLVNELFAVINADDYYGASAFSIMSEHLQNLNDEKNVCVVGYYQKKR